MKQNKTKCSNGMGMNGVNSDSSGSLQITGRGIITKTVKISIIIFILIYVVTPSVLITYPWIQSKAVFLNMLIWPPFVDLTKPEDLGLINVKNYYLDVNEEVNIGVWHIPPPSANLSGEIDYESLLRNTEKPIILYLHGTSGSRGGWHRVQLYKLLVSMEYQVFAFDYRGYADSLGYPSEDGVVQDSYFMYKWIKERCGNTPVFLWGHSLGTAITTKLAKRLASENDEPYGIVLESPFTNIREAAAKHPFTFPYRSLPCFESVFLDSISVNNIYFQSDVSIHSVKTSLLILHAEDDLVVPYVLGKKLYGVARRQRPINGKPIIFESFNASYGYGHKLIFKAPELTSIFQNFVNTCLSFHT